VPAVPPMAIERKIGPPAAARDISVTGVNSHADRRIVRGSPELPDPGIGGILSEEVRHRHYPKQY